MNLSTGPEEAQAQERGRETEETYEGIRRCVCSVPESQPGRDHEGVSSFAQQHHHQDGPREILSLPRPGEWAVCFHRRVLSSRRHSILFLPPHEYIPHDSPSPISSVSRMTRIMTGFAAKCVRKCICSLEEL